MFCIVSRKKANPTSKQDKVAAGARSRAVVNARTTQERPSHGNMPYEQAGRE